MSTFIILGILKYAGILISGISSAWGLLTKTTFEDERGRKRLTASGQIALIITMASSIIGVLAYGFEGLAQRDAKASEKIEAENRDRLDREGKARARDEQRARDAAEWRYRQEQREQALAQARKQEMAMLLAFSEQRTRDNIIERRVSEGNARSLSRMEQTISEVGRVAWPLLPVSFGVSMAAQVNSIKGNLALTNLKSISLDSDRPSIGKGSPAYEILHGDPTLTPLFKYYFSVMIFSKTSDALKCVSAIKSGEQFCSADFSFRKQAEMMTGMFKRDVQEIYLLTKPVSISADNIQFSNRMTSVVDLKGSSLVAFFMDPLTPSDSKKEEIVAVNNAISVRSFNLRFNGKSIFVFPMKEQEFRTPSGTYGFIAKRFSDR
ncbi:MAP7 domain-containing protein [Sphingomonas sp. NPDC079357]|uniref:MAP7 domain-containing protein n=1 Tax=Sphingomonas sp. NPDC079357 TaxID=3364518 RepID=UPI00384D82E7